MSYAWVYLYRSYIVIDPSTCGACYLESFASQNSLHQVEILLVLPNILKASFCHECPPYLPICGIYLPFQVNLHVPNSKPSNNNLFCMPESLMQRLGAVSIFHARWVILKMSGLRSSFMRKMAGNRDAQSHDQKIKIKSKNNCKQNSPRIDVSWRHALFRASHGLMIVGGGGVKIFTSLFGNRL